MEDQIAVQLSNWSIGAYRDSSSSWLVVNDFWAYQNGSASDSREPSYTQVKRAGMPFYPMNETLVCVTAFWALCPPSPEDQIAVQLSNWSIGAYRDSSSSWLVVNDFWAYQNGSASDSREPSYTQVKRAGIYIYI